MIIDIDMDRTDQATHSLKKVNIAPELENRENLVRMVRAAVPLVEKLFGKSASRVSIDFTIPSHRNGAPLVRISVADDLAEEFKTFREIPVDQLKSPEFIKRQVYQLWRGLMDAALEKSIDYLKANVPTE